MEEQSCPRCKTTKYRNPSLKLMVNVCGHTLCENCVELLFVRGSAACPECQTALRRNNFRLKIFEDAAVEKEVDIRKRVLKDYNKKEEDFASLREYNDYLEEVETIVFNLAYGVDVENTRRQMEQYKKNNRDIIMKNKVKLSKDEELIELYLEQEKRDTEIRKQHVQTEMTEKNTKLKNKESLIDDLMFSDAPADSILESHREMVKLTEIKPTLPRQAATQFSTGIQMGQRNIFMPITVQKGELYSYKPICLEMCGPELPTYHNLVAEGYLNHVRTASEDQRAGGYEASMACQRALQESMCGLFYSFQFVNPSPVPSTSSSEISEMEVS